MKSWELVFTDNDCMPVLAKAEYDKIALRMQEVFGKLSATSNEDNFVRGLAFEKLVVVIDLPDGRKKVQWRASNKPCL